MRGPQGSSWAGEADNKLRSALQRRSRSGNARRRKTQLWKESLSEVYIDETGRVDMEERGGGLKVM